MKRLQKYLLFLLVTAACTAGALNAVAEPLYSPTWGFSLDLPEGYDYAAGDGKNRFSFVSSLGTVLGTALDLVVYPGGTYTSVEALARSAGSQLGNRGEVSRFKYRDREAALMELLFVMSGASYSGWALCVELDRPEGAASGSKPPLLIALAYGPAQGGFDDLHLSALNSLAPSDADLYAPGPVMEFGWPRGERIPVILAGNGVGTWVREHDAEASQALVEREYLVLERYAASSLWQEAWTRFYRIIYRDAFDRLAEAAFDLERFWTRSSFPSAEEDRGKLNRDLASSALAWVQSFSYERNSTGSDFVNPVSAALEGRGDCDSRALLWALILQQADIPAAMMVSREYSHAMGLAELPGEGARFPDGDLEWLVAETTEKVALGLIGASVSDPAKWFAIRF